MKGKGKRDGQEKSWEDNIKKSGHEWTSAADLGQLKTGQDGKGVLRNHLWCPDDLPSLWDTMEYIHRTSGSLA